MVTSKYHLSLRTSNPNVYWAKWLRMREAQRMSCQLYKIWSRSINGDAVDCKSAAFGHAWFDPRILHQNLVCSYRGYYCGLSIRLRGFDSPTDRHFFTAIDYRLGQDTFNFQSGVRLPVAVPSLFPCSSVVE